MVGSRWSATRRIWLRAWKRIRHNQHIHEELMVVTAGSLEANMDGVKHTVPAGFGTAVRVEQATQCAESGDGAGEILRD